MLREKEKLVRQEEQRRRRRQHKANKQAHHSSAREQRATTRGAAGGAAEATAAAGAVVEARRRRGQRQRGGKRWTSIAERRRVNSVGQLVAVVGADLAAEPQSESSTHIGAAKSDCSTTGTAQRINFEEMPRLGSVMSVRHAVAVFPWRHSLLNCVGFTVFFYLTLYCNKTSLYRKIQILVANIGLLLITTEDFLYFAPHFGCESMFECPLNDLTFGSFASRYFNARLLVRLSS